MGKKRKLDQIPAGGPSAMDVLGAMSGVQDTETLTLPLEILRTDGGTQPRAMLDTQTVHDYAEAMAEGANFPPVEVVFDGESYWLWDGFHRHAASAAAGIATIRVHVTPGDKRQAQLLSCGVNDAHGLRRTNADKRRVVLRLLQDEEWSRRSDNWIAGACKVSQPMVSALRKTVTAEDVDPAELATRTGMRPEEVIRAVRQVREAQAAPRQVQRVQDGKVQVYTQAQRQPAADTERQPPAASEPPTRFSNPAGAERVLHVTDRSGIDQVANWLEDALAHARGVEVTLRIL